ncbi:MAG TPA: ADP-ribosylglycohydrolase family protein [Pirellulales bacterium]|nr:ADP-ribosylglycohydrolase family protein [Pirellulales bacterium]
MAVSERALVGSILGTAVGDALGLPYEGLSKRRAARLLGPPTRYRLLPGRGMISDDTEHACMTMQALTASGDDVETFARQLAKRLRLWLLAVPAGAGLATLKATTRLCFGVPPHRSGVFSAGNGPAMRSAVLGTAIDDLDLLQKFVRASTRITHTDPQAEHGALAVALAARWAADGLPISPGELAAELQSLLPDENAQRFHKLIGQAVESAARGDSAETFAAMLGLERGVSGYVYHTVPVALQVWFRRPTELPEAVVEVVRCGGDTDSTAAIVGGIIGGASGKDGIPADWLSRLWEWPRTVAWMEQLACRLYEARSRRTPLRPPTLPAWGVLPRNACFAAVVLGHGLRRVLPPY